MSPDSVRAQLIANAMRRCRHFDGTMNPRCRAGVAYASVAVEPPGVERDPSQVVGALPCFADEQAAAGRCVRVSFPTFEEAAAEAEAVEHRLDRTEEAIGLIRTASKGAAGWAGVVSCPMCGGRLHGMKAAGIDHVWGRCETAGCLSWRQ